MGVSTVRRNFITCIFPLLLFATTSLAQAPGPFPIGAVLALTGPAQAWGKYARMGAELAIDEINSAGGIRGQKVTLALEDSRSQPALAVSAFNALLAKAAPRAIFGDVWTQLDEPLIPLAARARVLLLAPTIVPWTIDAPGDYFFTMGQKPETAAGAVSAFFNLHPEVKTVSIFCWDNSWGRTYLSLWKDEAARRGITVLNEICVNDFSYDYRTDAAKVTKSKPDAVFIAHFAERILKLLAERNFHPQVLSTSNMVEVLHDGSLPKELAEGVYFTDWTPSSEFVQKFESRYREKPILESHNSYEAIHSIARAAAAGGSDLRVELKKVRYQGVAGSVDFTKSFAGNDSTARLMMVKNGAPVSVSAPAR